MDLFGFSPRGSKIGFLVPKALALIYLGPAIESLTDGLTYMTGIDCLTVLEAKSVLDQCAG